MPCGAFAALECRSSNLKDAISGRDVVTADSFSRKFLLHPARYLLF